MDLASQFYVYFLSLNVSGHACVYQLIGSICETRAKPTLDLELCVHGAGPVGVPLHSFLWAYSVSCEKAGRGTGSTGGLGNPTQFCLAVMDFLVRV